MLAQLEDDYLRLCGRRVWLGTFVSRQGVQAVNAVKIVVSAIGASLQHALPSSQMLIGIGCHAIPGEVEDRRR